MPIFSLAPGLDPIDTGIGLRRDLTCPPLPSNSASHASLHCVRVEPPRVGVSSVLRRPADWLPIRSRTIDGSDFESR